MIFFANDTDLKKDKDVGINRKLDDLGRIVIPISYRRSAGFTPEMEISMEFFDACVILKEKDTLSFSRKIDSLGRILIPIEFRNMWSWKENDLIKVIPSDSNIILKKVSEKCVFCYGRKDLISYENKKICEKCKKIY